MEFTLVYDASAAGFPWGTVLHFVIMLIAGVVLLIVSAMKKRPTGIIFMTIWIAFVLIIGGLGSSNVVSQHLKCKKWVESQDFKIVEGVVTDFHAMPKTGHDTERFKVEGIKFEFSDYDLSKGGFNNTASHGGPIREVSMVAIK